MIRADPHERAEARSALDFRATDAQSIAERRAGSTARASGVESRALKPKTHDGYRGASQRWSEFYPLYGLPRALFIYTHWPRELLWLRTIARWWYDWWINTRHGVRGPGMMEGNTITNNLNKALTMMARRTGQELWAPIKALAQSLATGHDAQVVDMAGVKGRHQAAPITLDLMEGFAEQGWESALGYMDPLHRREFADNCDLATNIGYEFGLRSACLFQVDPRYEFHSSWNLSRGDIQYYGQDFNPVEPTPENLPRIHEEGGYVSLPHKPSKGDPLGKKHGAKKRFFEIRPRSQPPSSPIEAGNKLLRHDLRYPVELHLRHETPLLVDPRTLDRDGRPTWLRKTAYMKAFYLLLQAVILALYTVTLSITVLVLAYTFHSFRAAYQNAHQQAGTESHIIEMGGGWVPGSTARLGYQREAMLEQLKAQKQMKQSRITATLPERLGQLHTAMVVKASKRSNAGSNAALQMVAAADTDVLAHSRVLSSSDEDCEEETPPRASRRPSQAKLYSRANRYEVTDTLGSMFDAAAEQYAAEISSDAETSPSELEVRILQEADSTEAQPPCPSGWIGAIILLASANTHTPARARAALTQGCTPERAKVVALEWDTDYLDFVATLHYEPPDDTEIEGTFTEVMPFSDLKLFKHASDSGTVGEPASQPVEPGAAKPLSSQYTGRDQQLARWAEDDTHIKFDTNRPKKDRSGTVKKSWLAYSTQTTINAAICAGATAQDLAYDLQTNRVYLHTGEINQRYPRFGP